MKYLGIDVHSKASVWCLLDEHGEVAGSGKTPTQFDDLQNLVTTLRKTDELVVGQEVGTQAYLVRDAVSSAGVQILSFNAAHLRVIAASRKKTDRRDAYWIAKSLQTGMTPHPVYLPDGLLRHVRELLTRRRIIQRDRNRWVYRGRALLRARGLCARVGKIHFCKLANQLLEHPDGVDTEALEGLGLCQRHIEMLDEDLAHLDTQRLDRTRDEPDVRRLMTIPGIGLVAAVTILAAVGDIRRFPNAKSLCSYAGLVPSVRQSGDENRLGGITREGSSALRALLVQSAHIVVSRCSKDDARPLQAIFTRIKGNRGRRRIALVALARHLLRVAFHVLREKTNYDPNKMRSSIST